MAAKGTLTVRLSDDTLQRLTAAADALGIPRSTLVASMLEEVGKQDIVGVVQSMAAKDYARVTAYVNEHQQTAIEEMARL